MRVEPDALILVVPDADAARTVRQHVQAWHPRQAWNTDVEVASQDVPARCRELRELGEGEVAVGALVETRAQEIEALAAGADEAMRLSRLSREETLLLLDRIVVRAAARREGDQLREAYARADKLAALGTLIAGVGHEINNPLSALLLTVSSVRGTVARLLDASWELRRSADRGEGIPHSEVKRIAELVRHAPLAADGAQVLDELTSAGEAIASVVRDLRTFAQPTDHEAATLLDVNECVEQVLRLVSAELSGSGALVERDLDEPLPLIVAPRGRIIQVLSNLLINASHAVREVDRMQHRVRITTRADDDAVAISVTDTGPGVPPEVAARIFDPFFSTKGSERGMGLGLSLSRSIALGLGGDLLVDSVYGEGATFVCLLPLPTAEQRMRAYRSTPIGAGEPRESHRLSLLLFDDDERVVRAYSRYLGASHKLILARDGLEASELLLSGSHPDLIVAELASPELPGPQFRSWLEQHVPELQDRLVFVLGQETPIELVDWAESTELPLLSKPLRTQQLDDVLRRALQRTSEMGPEEATELGA